MKFEPVERAGTRAYQHEERRLIRIASFNSDGWHMVAFGRAAACTRLMLRRRQAICGFCHLPIIIRYIHPVCAPPKPLPIYRRVAGLYTGHGLASCHGGWALSLPKPRRCAMVVKLFPVVPGTMTRGHGPVSVVTFITMGIASGPSEQAGTEARRAKSTSPKKRYLSSVYRAGARRQKPWKKSKISPSFHRSFTTV